MGHKDRTIFAILMFFSLFFLLITILLGVLIITDGFIPDLVFAFGVSALLLLLSGYLLARFVKKSEYKGYIYLCFKMLVWMTVMGVIFTCIGILTRNGVLAFGVLIILSIFMALYLVKETREKGIYKESSKICCSYKNVNVWRGKNQAEEVKVGDALNGPFVRSKKLWELRNQKGNVVGCVYRPDIIADLKSRKIQGLNIFTVSKIDSKGNIYVDIDVYISKYNSLNLWASYDDSLEKTYFIVNSDKEPAKSLTVTKPVLENENDVNSINGKFILQSKEVFLGEVFENVKIVDYSNWNAHIFDNEALKMCYDENGDILLMSNFDSVPVGHIADEKINGLINTYKDLEGLIIISVQKIENNNEANKKDVYVKVLLYK